MNVLPLPFIILTYFGIWMPVEWTSGWKKNLYKSLSIFVLSVMYTFVGSQLIEVIIHFSEYKTISPTLYLLLTTSSACYKAVAFLIIRSDVISMSKLLLVHSCIPRGAEEKEIQRRADKTNRCVTGICVLLVYSNIIIMVLAPLLQLPNMRDLPYKTWLPYCIRNPRNYWLSYLHQTVGLLCCGSVSLAIDNIITGFMFQACVQFDLLEHRFKTLPTLIENIRCQLPCKEANQVEKIILVEHLQHHNHLYLYAKNLKNTFSSIIFVQFFASAMVITFSVFQLSVTNPENVDFINVLIYLISMLTEFFLYCWFGNEINLKSTNFSKNVYKSNWMILNLQSWKMILFSIHRSSKPVVISCYNLVKLSLQNFVQMLQVSYSAYNLLRKFNVD